ncbi:hypothetical protein [Mangrovicoccus ximenensis]|uniref:hypothetical protein n=1 Tax=Mangrovicoccus ximenensis TaxID=1911570 RepID=UPI000D3BD803|nr:hypothetical protein [Mangrovicoccus ximenensis]
MRVCGTIGDLHNRAYPQALGDFATILRFPRIGFTWDRDPDAPRSAFRNKDTIPPQRLEGRTTEGWVKIIRLAGLGRARAARNAGAGRHSRDRARRPLPLGAQRV